jgi:hypothetical protein
MLNCKHYVDTNGIRKLCTAIFLPFICIFYNTLDSKTSFLESGCSDVLLNISILMMSCTHVQRDYCRYLADRVPPCTRLKSSPTAPDSAPGRGGLRCRHVSPRLQTRSRCQRALASPRAPWHRARHPLGEGSGVATCPAAPNPPPGTEGSGITMCPMATSPPPCRRGLQSHHVSRSSRPVPCAGRL